MEKKNQVLMTVLGVFALVIVTVGISYAFFTYTRTGTTQTKIETSGGITTGTISFIYSEGNNVTLSNAYPTTVDVGKELTNTYDFVITGNISGVADAATAIGYDIYAVNSSQADTSDGKNEEVLSDSRVRAYLTKLSGDQVETPVLNTDDQTVLMSDVIKDNSTKEGILYSDSLQFPAGNKNSQTQTYRLRIWLDSIASSDLGEGGVNITDDGTGTLPSPSGEGDQSYELTEDNKGVTVKKSNGQTTTYVYSLKVKVVAREVTNPGSVDVERPGS